MDKVRTTIVLPGTTAAKLRERVPPRKRSRFIAEAIERYLMQIGFETEREGSFGSWSDEDYPELRTREDMQRYIGARRDDTTWRQSTVSSD